MSKHIETFKSWAESFHQDVAAIKQLLESETAHSEARKFAAAALNYLVTRMDLVPDSTVGIGALDDVMVVRACMAMAQGHALGDLPGDAEISIGRLGNDADRVAEFLGRELNDRFRQYVARLTETAVRGRTPQNVVDDEAARKALYADVDEEIKRSVPVVIKDPADAELQLRAYLTHKLK